MAVEKLIAFPCEEVINDSNFLHIINSQQRPSENETGLKAASLFSGGGGLDLGLTFAGFDIRFSSDKESQHCETILSNFPDAIVSPIDILNLTGQKIRELTGEEDFDLLAGGPPCQAFSILGKRNSFSDPRGKMVFEFARIVTELNPKAFLFENVPGLMTVNKGADWNELLSYLEKSTGYSLFTTILNSANFGIPQIRKRVFIVGFRDHSIAFNFPIATHYENTISNMLFSSGNRTWTKSNVVFKNLKGVINHDIRIHGERVRNRYLKVPQGGRDKVDRTDRIDPERPSGTVLVGSKAGGGRPFIHPFEPRHISVREAARLQSFPDWYIFQNTNTWQYRAVGNAVPPLLAKAIGLQIKEAILNL